MASDISPIGKVATSFKMVSPSQPLLSRRQRSWYAGVGFLLLGLLTLARALPPNPSGFGTHRALGLPPCTALHYFGIPCPTCGMTTAWAHLLRGDLPQAWACNPGGVCLAGVALLVGTWSTALAVRGRYHPLLSTRASCMLAVTILCVTLSHWLNLIF